MNEPIPLSWFEKHGTLTHNGIDVMMLHNSRDFLEGVCVDALCQICGIKKHFTLSPLSANPEDIRYQILELCSQINQWPSEYYVPSEEEMMKKRTAALEEFTKRLGFRSK